MQSAFRPGLSGHRFRLVGAVLVGVGLVAAAPMASSASGVQQRPVHLVNSAADTGAAGAEWSSIMAAASNNLAGLGREITADPLPVLSQLSDNLSGDAGIVGSSIQSSWQGLAGVFLGDGAAVGLVKLLPTVLDDISKGDGFAAYSALNSDFLYDFLHIVQPYFSHVPWGTSDFVPGILGIPGTVLQHITNLYDTLSSYPFWDNIAPAVMSPLIGADFETVGIADAVGAELSAGNVPGALGMLANAPVDVLGALLNGYAPPNSSDSGSFLGVLTAGGPLDIFLVDIPQAIAHALGGPATDAAGAAAADLADGLLSGI